MKNELKRILALALVLVMVVGFVPANVFAAEADPALPTASITPMENADGHTFAVDIKSEPTAEQATYYGSWKADFELRFNKDITLNAAGTADGFVSIKNASLGMVSWNSAPEVDVTLPAGAALGVMSYVMTNPAPTFNFIPAWFSDFQLGIAFDEDFLEANPDLQATIELKLYDPETNEPTVIASYTYGAPALPTATVSNLEKEGLTFGLNFKVDDATAEQLAYYGEWYADFELSINKEVTFNANGGKDGYLSGEYGEYGWINAPIEDVTLAANEPLRIMEYAAEMKNEPGLKYKYEEVYDVVKEFNCGVFFEDAFLQANPDLKVSLVLKLYNPTNENESYNVGPVYEFTAPTAPQMPTATATEIQNDKLTYAMNFKVDEVTAWQLAYYGKWYADFEIVANKDIVLDANGTGDGWLSGQYDGEWESWNGTWVNVPFKAPVTLKAGEPVKILATAAEQMGEPGLKYTFQEAYDVVKDFDCGIFLEPQFLIENPDLEITLRLRMYNRENESEAYTIGEDHVFTVAEAPERPTATAVDLNKDDLTFAMTFKADEVTPAQLAYYGKWYADFELTVNKDVTLDANGTGDGWLSGQYDGEWEDWHGEWLNVPFDEPVTLNANQPLKIMAFAAEKLGEPGLKYTYKEVYEVVKEFNCGAYFTPEFLAANPDLEVKLQLKMYNPHDESISYVVGNTYIFKNDFVAYNVQTGKLYTEVSKAVQDAVDGQTVRLLKDATDTVVAVLDGVTLDLDGFVLTTNYLFVTGDLVDDSEDNTGLLKASNNVMMKKENRQLPVKTADGYKFFEILGFNTADMVPEKENAIKYAFQPKFEAAAHEDLKAGQATTGVRVIVRVTWTRNDGTAGVQDFVYNDDKVNTVLNSYNPATGKYGQMYTLELDNVSSYQGLTYQVYVVSECSPEFTVASVTESETNLNTSGATAVVPEGTKVTGSLALKVTDLESSNSNITVAEGETLKSVDVHVQGVATDNTKPVLVTVEAMAEAGLNNGNLKLYHVEKGVSNKMTQVATLAEVDEHNEFWYDPATGNVTMALATFSEIALVAEPARWEGVFDYTWYDASKTELLIANADQLAGFGAIVGGMNGKTADDFDGKTVKLINNIKIGDITDEDGRALMFYPIGYYNTTESYVKEAGVDVTSGFRNFSGTFDGNGHVISDFYQNTWEAFGDYNDGYSGKPNHYRDGFGLFGKVYKGTVKNLTVKNFQSDGEYTTTGTIAAYAEGATFENIAIFKCNPRVYNIGNGGIVGCVGWYAKEAGLKTTFKNITVDNTNKISALWGSWDVACGGIVGQYYPTSGQTSANKPANGGIYFENCHVAAQIDVYNDVCANYQYYAYRYAGILMGSVRENVIKDGHEYPDMTGITAANCTVHFGDWNDYYYCELVANSLASYTHDHQMSRLTQVQSVDDVNMKIVTLEGKEEAIPTSGAANYVVVRAKGDNGMWIHGDGKDYATCYHFVNGAVWNHEQGGYETTDIDGDGTIDSNVLKEDKQLVYREFNNLVTGYGWGVTSKGVEDMDGVEILDKKQDGSSMVKFNGKGVAEIESETVINIGDLFSLRDGITADLKKDALSVTITDLDETDGIATATFAADATTWENGTLTIHGKGRIAITIQDYYFCEPTTIEVTVIDPMESLTIDATTLYSVGQTLNIKSVTVAYKSGATAEISADKYTVSNVDMSYSGKKLVTVTYTEYGKTISANITVTVSGDFNSLIATPNKSVYEVGETPTFTVNAIADDGTKGAVTDFETSEIDEDSVGIQTVTITFGGTTTTCKVNFVNTTIINSHKLWNFYSNGFYLGSSQQYYIYNDYLTSAFPGGANGEAAVGFNNTPAGGAVNPESPSGIEYYLGANQYDLKITNALPYSTLGIGCVTAYDVIPVGFGYYIGDDVTTINYSAPTIFVDEVAAGNSEYANLVSAYGSTGVSANTKFTPNSFEPGKTYVVHWVAVFNDGLQPLADWTVKMKSSVSDDYFENTDKPDVNVVVLSGQSNAAGATPITQEVLNKLNINYKNVYMQYKNVYLYEDTNKKLQIATQNQNHTVEKYYAGMGGYYDGSFGPDAALAYYLATTEGLKDEQWFIIKYAAPGTNLDAHWLQNSNLADDMLDYVESCIDELSENYDVQLRSFLWMQGENDALDQNCAEDYAVNEQTLASKFRARFAAYDVSKPNYLIPGSGIAFISAGIAPAGKDGNVWTYAATVNAAKRDNAYAWYAPGEPPVDSALYGFANAGMTMNPNAAGIYNSAYIDTSLMSGQAADPAHYDQQSMEWLGTWFGEYVGTMMNIQLPAPPPPSAETYTVFLNANGGVLASDMLDVEVGGTVTLPTPTREGYYFAGWYDVNGNKADESYTPTANIMLDARWGNRMVTVQNNVDGVTVTGVTNNQILNAGEIVNVVVTNNSGRTITVAFNDATNNTLIYKPTVENGASIAVPYAMDTNFEVVVAELYTISNTSGTVNDITWSADKSSANANETVTITFANTKSSRKTVYVTVTDRDGYRLERTRVRLNGGSSTTQTFTVGTSDVTITVSPS